MAEELGELKLVTDDAPELCRPGGSASNAAVSRLTVMDDPEVYVFAPDGGYPNSRLPLLVYRGGLPPDATFMEHTFAENGWYPRRQVGADRVRGLAVFEGLCRLGMGKRSRSRLDGAGLYVEHRMGVHSTSSSFGRRSGALIWRMGSRRPADRAPVLQMPFA